MRLSILLSASVLTLPAVVAPARAVAQGLAPAEILSLRLRADSLYDAGDCSAGPLYARVGAANPWDGEARYLAARCRFRAGQLDEAIRGAEEAIAAGFADEARVGLPIAQALARAGRGEEALAWLRRAVDAGLEERPSIKGDEAFAGLRDDPRFREIAGSPPPGERSRDDRWRVDLDFLLAEARRLSGNPERPAWAPAFERAVEELKSRVPDLTDLEVATGVQRIVALLEDGHSVMYPMSTETVEFDALPLAFYVFADGLHIVRAPSEHADLVGARVVAIGGRDVGTLVQDLDPYVARDNTQGLRWIGPTFARFPAFLVAMGYGTRTDGVVLTVVDGHGTTRDVEVAAGPVHGLETRLLPLDARDPDTPLWLRKAGENYWHETLPGLDALYVQFNQVRDEEGGPDLEAYARILRDALAASGAENLIVDVRHNNGGNNFLIWPLIRLIGWHETNGGRTWVITGRNTFSAAQDFVNFVDRGTNATFVGEVSSSRPNYTGEDTWVELPYSKLRISISSRYWQDSWPGDDRPWVPVAMPVELRAEDYFSHRDPVMDALAEVLGADAPTAGP